MKKSIVVLMGGISGERDISILTGNACLKALRKKGYKALAVDAKGFFSNQIKRIKPQVVFNALHGQYGEDGYVQSILEYLKLPYTHSGVIASNLAMDKELSRIIFKKNKLLVPKYFSFIKKNHKVLMKEIIKKKIKFPIVLKPTSEGSSLGVYICENIKQLKKNFKILNRNYNKILVEEYISGKEIQVAVMGKLPLGAIELVPKRKFYDYTAKYSSLAKTKHIMPAQLSKKNYNKALSLAKKAHKILGCRGVTRSDFKFFKNKFYLLEINTQPGMTKLSLVPEIAKFKGISFEKLIEWMIKDASCKR